MQTDPAAEKAAWFHNPPLYMKTTICSLIALFALALGVSSAATKAIGPVHTVFVSPDGGFDISIIAALEKKHVPLKVVADPSLADYVFSASPVTIHKESGAGKIARCAFAYCAGIADSGSVSIQLTDTHSKTIVWGYNVAKQRAAKNTQSMAEAIAKHLENDFLAKQE